MSSPSKPVAIKSPRLAAAEIPQSTRDSLSATPIGTPNLQALRNQYVGTPPMPNIPPRVSSAQKWGSPSLNFPGAGTPSSYRQAVGGISASMATAPSASGTATPNGVDLDGLPDGEKAKVLARHLVSKVERQNGGDASSELNVPIPGPSNTSRRSSSGQNTAVPIERDPSEPFPIPYDAPGADVTHDIYKWHADKTTGFRTRLRSVSYAGASRPQIDPAFEHIHEPGGFRRNYLLLRANEQGTSEAPRLLNNFIDFLFLYGHFAGEDLEDDEDKEDDDAIQEVDEEDEEPTEQTPLFSGSRRSRSRSQVRSSSQGPQGTASVTGAVMMLLKSFIGTGVLFLGKAFYNGGLLFSSITFVAIAAISLYSFLLLVKAKLMVAGSFGDIGGTLYGPWLRYLILTSIVVSQIGFCAAYTIFVAENLDAFVQSVTHCLTRIPSQYFILIQLVVFLPLALVRNLGKLSITILIADAFIFAGLVYIFGSEIAIVSKRGIADVKMFNPKDFSLFIGTAVFSFEGIGLVIPITDAMKEPHKFPLALSGVMFFLTILFGGAGALAYMTFGSEVQTVVLVNLNTKSPMVQAVQLLYSMAILLSIPLQFFPAVRILENGLFTRSGKADSKVKWYKNFFRFSMVMVSTAIAWFGSADLDKFVAFVGCFACVPLCYIYPAMLHYKACARTRGKKLADIAMIFFGGIVAIYTTIQTVKLMVEPAPSGSPTYVCEA